MNEVNKYPLYIQGFLLFVSPHTHYMLFGFSTDTTCSLVSPAIAVKDERINVLRELIPCLSGDHNNISARGGNTFIDLLLASVAITEHYKYFF